MAELVLGLATSHTPMLNATAADWREGKFAAVDAKRAHRDKAGAPVDYAALAAAPDPRAAAEIAPALMAEKHARAQAGLSRVATALADARLDALIVIGDDQNELIDAANLPAILVYRGAAIANRQRVAADAPLPDWYRAALAAFYDEPGRDYPVDAALAEHLVGALTAAEFDVATSDGFGDAGEGHAFAFLHKRLMGGGPPIPIVPVFLNAYYPPNQPSPARCHALGRAIRAAVAAYPAAIRVGVAASGGLSHFTVDEELDRAVLAALAARDRDALTGLSPAKLQAGSSEIRNWICAAGALEGLDLAWSDYIPGYRTPAGTGTGIGFALWA